MKKLFSTFLAAFTTLAVVSCGGADHDHDHGDHDHDHKHGDGHDHDHDHEHFVLKAGPNGGRVLESAEPNLEFFVKDDRTVQIIAVDAEQKAIALGDQSVTVTAGDRSSPTILKFEKNGDALVSDNALPAGNLFPVVVAIKTSPDDISKVEKFNINFEQCPDCPNLEYACTCAHAH